MAEGTLRGYSRLLDGYNQCLYSLYKDSPRPHCRTAQTFKSCGHAGNSLIILALLSLTSDHYRLTLETLDELRKKMDGVINSLTAEGIASLTGYDFILSALKRARLAA